MKKFIPIIILAIIFFAFLDYKYTQGKNKDITYAVEKYLTTGIFRSYKLSSIDTLQLAFSDNNISVVTVAGVQSKSPYRKVKYQVIVEKKSSGFWKVQKVYYSK